MSPVWLRRGHGFVSGVTAQWGGHVLFPVKGHIGTGPRPLCSFTWGKICLLLNIPPPAWPEKNLYCFVAVWG